MFLRYQHVHTVRCFLFALIFFSCSTSLCAGAWGVNLYFRIETNDPRIQTSDTWASAWNIDTIIMQQGSILHAFYSMWGASPLMPQMHFSQDCASDASFGVDTVSLGCCNAYYIFNRAGVYGSYFNVWDPPKRNIVVLYTEIEQTLSAMADGFQTASAPLPDTTESNVSEYSLATILIAPNPSNGVFHLSGIGFLYSEISINVVDATGRMVFTATRKEWNSTEPWNIDLSAMATGIYFILVQSENEIRRIPLVISGN